MDTKFGLRHEKLGDRQWLYQKYWEEKLSLNEIGVIVGCKHSSVRHALVRSGIQIRTRGEGLRNARRGGDDWFVLDRSMVEGCLLGDGGLVRENKYSGDSFPFFSVATVHYDHAMWMGKQLFSQSPELRVKERYGGGFGGGSIFRVNTNVHTELMDLYQQWYPEENGFGKIVPPSLVVDEKVLLHWFLGDGYTYFVNRPKCKTTRRVRVQFATQSFSLSDLNLLCEKVKDKFGLVMKPRFHRRHGVVKGTGYYVELSEAKNEAAKFYEIIGPPPVASLAYKWKIR